MPNGRIRPRTDVGVNPLHLQSILGYNVRYGSIGNEFVPDTKGGGRTADVGFGKAGCGGGESTGSYAGVDADAYLLRGVGEGFADAFELGYGAVLGEWMRDR